MSIKKISSALISVFDKDGLEPIVKKLHEQGVTFYSTGGTEAFIKDLDDLSKTFDFIDWETFLQRKQSKNKTGKPKLLLLDEPSLGLAPNIVSQIFELIKEISKEGITILLIEQNAFMALKVSDRAYVLENGIVSLEGLSKDIIDDDKVREIYLGI